MSIRYRYQLNWFVNNRDRFECEPYLIEFESIKDTLHGSWIRYKDKKKFVLNGAGKRFAHESKLYAFAYFVHRNLSYKSTMERKVQCLDDMLNKNEYQKYLQPNSLHDIMGLE
jgi:hypothetical protein